MKNITLFGWSWRMIALLILFYICYLGGAQALSGKLPDIMPEPGLVPVGVGLLLVGIANTLLVTALVVSSQWSGLRLTVLLSMAYFGAVTFVMQIETWYFLSDITVNAELMPYLFVMGFPVAFIFVPFSVWILGKWQPINNSNSVSNIAIPFKQWIWKLSFIAVAYLTLYWLAGYFIAWQNPELRAFYGSPGAITPFWEHTANTFKTDPGLFLFQIMRALIWTLCALPVIFGSKLNAWWTALLVAFLFSIPQNLGHIMENSLIPGASIRLSHFIETASSTFIFGLIVFWLLHRKHESLRDLFRGKPSIIQD
ncbi:MAG: hypothetical protein Q8J88_14895 [Bacteroidales bacterium]|nr:hypothetical protein [Bacteroidales bacterium]